MKNLFYNSLTAFVAAAGMLVTSCQKDLEPAAAARPDSRAGAQEITSALDTVQLIRLCSVDPYLANPLDAGEYRLNDNVPFFNVVSVESIKLMDSPGGARFEVADRLSYILKNRDRLIAPLQAKGIEVLATVMGANTSGWGFANLSPDEINDMAQSLVNIIMENNLDGVALADKWTSYGANGKPQPNTISYSRFILALREALPAGKKILLENVGHVSDFTPEVVGCLDLVTNNIINFYDETCTNIPGVPNSKWAGCTLAMNAPASARTIQLYSKLLVASGQGAINFIRICDTYPQTMLEAFVKGAYGPGVTVSHTGVFYEKEWN